MDMMGCQGKREIKSICKMSSFDWILRMLHPSAMLYASSSDPQSIAGDREEGRTQIPLI